VSLLPQPIGAGPALVLRAWPAGETSAVVSLLTAAHGGVRAVAKGARLARSRLQALVQPGRLVEIEYTLVPGRELQFLRGGSVVLDPLAQGATLERSAYLLAALEIIDRDRPAAGEDADVFRLGEAYVRVLSSAIAGAEAGCFYAFEVAWLDRQGIRPQFTACLACERPLDLAATRATWLDLAAGGLVCGECRERAAAAARPVDPATLAWWPFLAAAPAQWPQEPLPRSVARDWGILLHRFLEYHLPGYRLPAALDLLRRSGLAAAGADPDEEQDA
jgi:DNA repair protein RecO (recombination protein O)